MKTRFIFFLLPLLWLTISCDDSDSDSATLEVSQSTFDNVSTDGTTLAVNVTCNSSWSVSSNRQWCIPDKKNGEKDDVLSIEIQANLEADARSAIVTIVSDKTTEVIKISQEGYYHYQLPVIFQVLYVNETDKNQYIDKGRVNEIITAVNKLYNNSNNKSVDMNLEFVLAAKDPEGKTLAEPGVHRIHVDQAAFDCEEFMGEENNLQYIWDTDQYINIVLYTFTDENILGISHLPYTVKPDKLDGLNQLSSLPTHSNLPYPHCVSINNIYIYEEPSIEGRTYNSLDVVATIAHELGHYLGLFHTFSEEIDEDSETTNDLCKDTDYCDDTPTYNRSEYINYLTNALGNTELTWDLLSDLMKRTDCITNVVSTPNNIMDYEISWLNRFTLDQRERIRYVLMHSPFVPGPKIRATTTRATTSPIEFPMRMIK